MNTMTTYTNDLASILPHALIQFAGPHALIARPGLSPEEQLKLFGKLIALAQRTSKYQQTALVWLCDALASHHNPRRGQLSEIARATGVSAGSLRNVKMVCARIKPSCRRDTLSWSHHMEAGMASDNEQQISDWLDRAQRDDLSVIQLRHLIRNSLRTSSSTCPADNSEGRSMKILRELYATMRILKLHRSEWENWTKEEWQQAATGLEPLLQFTSALNSKVRRTPRRSS